ncbi:uncharacterized protein CCOS01_16370 [Colletotrichum costaricense]|uniref:Uncharacterized protein n=2 Tax=Colletotrichum acutatum species complex TaxID=2707335 RepID=A0AAJ0DST1_9PEZI|nr:uncharacterized protein CCOS01_16370 [Colletotrichum costaricense]XP_060386681.1 uncharacterized protein CTAM01_02840 [Colletotrichum tamarilloi]KAK1507111.1 hypothetical protein CCOS01_16370 [Colletotrichum costaricense]KAK1507728.1 hypothetical protein CTAM01_02840 [Colletotrichum tamarilloi]
MTPARAPLPPSQNAPPFLKLPPGPMWKSNAGKFCFCLSTSLLPMNAWLTPHTTLHTDTPISRSLAPSHTRLPHFSHTPRQY